MKFYNQVLLRSLEITQSQPQEFKVLVSDKFEFPSLAWDDYGRVLRVPKPVKGKEGFMLEGIIFGNNDLGRTLLMKMLMSSVEHLSIHSIISDFSVYNNWLKYKDVKLAVFVIDLIEDLCVKHYARSRLKGLLQDMAFANAVSYAFITDTEKINSKQSLFQSALLSFLIAGRYRFLLPSYIKEDVLAILQLLHNFEKAIWQGEERSGNSLHWLDDEINGTKIRLADQIYNRLAKYGSPRETAYLPYTDAHEQVERVNGELTLQMGQSIDIAADTFRTLGLQLTSDKSFQEILGNCFREEASDLLYDLIMEQRWKSKTIENYAKLAKNTEFDGLIFPEEDFAEYARSYAKYAGSIRKITEEIGMLKNDLDSNPKQQVGQVDMQEVIQAIASHKMSRNIFIRDDYSSKSEAWAILVDVSNSLKPFSITARDMALCLSEMAKELIPGEQSWGLYAFNNRFTIVKEMGESYSQNVKARIGGLAQGGLSYIPDALQLTSHILASTGKDHNYLFVISDGLPSGYANIESKLEKSIEDVMRGGVTLISVGVGSNGLQKYIRGTSCKADSVYDLMRKFTKMYCLLATESNA